MTSVTLYVEDILSAARDGEAVKVQCTDTRYVDGTLVGRAFQVTITASDVLVTEWVGDGREARKPSDVLVSTSLVEATRRLFNMVGEG